MSQKINIMNTNGNISTITFKELKIHEESIIEDNICFGLMHGYSKKEISKYKQQAQSEWKSLQQKLQDNPKLVLILNNETERYIPYEI